MCKCGDTEHQTAMRPPLIGISDDIIWLPHEVEGIQLLASWSNLKQSTEDGGQKQVACSSEMSHVHQLQCDIFQITKPSYDIHHNDVLIYFHSQIYILVIKL